jgi:hypothetical protein
MSSLTNDPFVTSSLTNDPFVTSSLTNDPFVKRIFIKDDKISSNTNKSFEQEQEQEQEQEATNKQIVIESKESKQIIKKEKEKKMRVETKTWGLNNDDLSFETQLQLLNCIYTNTTTNTKIKQLTNTNTNTKHIGIIIAHIRAKISGYKQQDIIKTRFNEQEFVNFNDVVTLLHDTNMKCHYCSCETYLLYEIVRENKQWSLDRINNNIGHNKGNLLNACLECNLKRRRTNKDAFLFTKNLKIIQMK